MSVTAPFLVSLLLFAAAIGFGFWVSKQGRPYHPALFNIHKLVALAGVVLAAVRARSGFAADELPGWMALILTAAAIGVVMLFVTGALMSIREDEPGISLFFHRAGPVIIILSLVGAYLLF